MAEALAVRLAAVAALAEASGGVPDEDTHAAALRQQLEEQVHDKGCDLLQLNTMICESGLPKAMKANLQMHLSDLAKKAATAARRPMQNFQHVFMLFPTSIWKNLQGAPSSLACTQKLCVEMLNFGCRCPTERTKAAMSKLVATLRNEDDARAREVFMAEWKRIKRKSAHPSEWIETMPGKFEDFKAAYPKTLAALACFKGGAQPADPSEFVDVNAIEQGASLLPIRAARGAASSLAVAAAPAQQVGVGVSDMMMFAKGLTEMLSRQHVAMMSTGRTFRKTTWVLTKGHVL